MVHTVTHHTVARDVWPAVDWNWFGPAFERWLPEEIPLDSAQLVDEAVAKFDEAVTVAKFDEADTVVHEDEA